MTPIARLTLLEYFLAHHDDPLTCAQASLEWLSSQTGLRESVCLVLDGESTRLVGLVGLGLPPTEVAMFSAPLSDTDSPLVAALSAPAPVRVKASRGRGHSAPPFASPFKSGAFTACPLGAGRDNGQVAVGLLLLRTVTALPPDVGWLVNVLGQKIAQMHSRGSLSEEVRRLRRERSLFFTIINSVTDPILLTDINGDLLVANARAGKLFAAADDESRARKRAAELNRRRFSAALSRAAMDAVPAAREVVLVDPVDGSDLLYEVHSSAVEDSREGAGIVSVLRNVTDLRRATEQGEENYQKLRMAERAARAERDRLNLIIDSVADPIIVTDHSGATVLMNAPAEALFTSVSGDPVAAMLVRANDAHFSSFISSLLLGETDPGEVRRGELGLENPRSGELIPVEAIAGTVMTDTGELTAVVTILHDRREALERVRLYEQLESASTELQARVQAATAELATQNELLRRQAIELEHASLLKSQFLANMSHEFRTPLNAILGYSHLLLQGVAGDLRPKMRRQLQRIDSNGRHLLTIINEILDITRIEAGRMPIQPSEFNMNDLVSEVMGELDPVIARSRLSVTSTLADELPLMYSDRQKVKQIVVNLLGNALKFTPAGSVEIATTFDAAAQQASITVTDSGIGIAPENHEKIFEDFRQVDDSPSRHYGGAGLGLAICRRLAGALGGSIGVQSDVGKGAVFVLAVPVHVKP